MNKVRERAGSIDQSRSNVNVSFDEDVEVIPDSLLVNLIGDD